MNSKTQMDFDADPELKALRDEFMKSFAERKQKLIELEKKLHTEISVAVLQEIKFIAHKLAGILGSYGFPVLGKFAELIDDKFFDENDGDTIKLPSEILKGCVRLLIEGLTVAEKGQDSLFLETDERARKIISSCE